MFEQKTYFVYILASKRNGTLYTGVTSDLELRTQQHIHGDYEGFTKKYGVHVLAYYEIHEDVNEAIAREKQIKKWRRQWKLALIEKHNPKWIDLIGEEGAVLPLPKPM